MEVDKSELQQDIKGDRAEISRMQKSKLQKGGPCSLTVLMTISTRSNECFSLELLRGMGNSGIVHDLVALVRRHNPRLVFQTIFK